MTNTDQETSRVLAEIPADDKAMLDEILDHGEFTELIRETTNAIIDGEGFDKRTVYDARLRQVERTLTDKRDQIDALHRDIKELEHTRNELQSQRESTLTKEQEWTIAFTEFERSFRAGEFGHVDDRHPRIKDLSKRYGNQPGEIHSELADRNPDVPEYAFIEAYLTTDTFTGLPENQIGVPVDERSPLEEGN